MSRNKSLVLVVDDDIRMLRMIKRTLELEDFDAVTAPTAEAALKAMEKETPDLVLLDIMMPDMDGYSLCQRIREFSQMPIIMVTAKGDDKEKVKGLNSGADDYITKPFSVNELTARVRAMLRRAAASEQHAEPVFRSNGLDIDYTSRRVRISDSELNLTSTEYKLLSYISLNAGRVVTPDQLLIKVWGEEYTGEPHLVQVNIARLRKKLGDNARHPTFIFTRPGIGYIMMKPAQPPV